MQLPLKPRRVMGGLKGESAVDRNVRLWAFIEANPNLTGAEIAEAMGTPYDMTCAMVNQVKTQRLHPPKPVFLPRDIFNPAPPAAPTARERIAAIPRQELDAIAERYGAVVRPRKGAAQ
jgi:hypothetical protein